MQDLGELDGVCTFCEMAVPLVARIAETLGLPGNSPDAVDAARDKHSTRAKMAAAGLPTPRNMLIQQPSDIAAAAEKVKFPAGAKPQTSCTLTLPLLLAFVLLTHPRNGTPCLCTDNRLFPSSCAIHMSLHMNFAALHSLADAD